MTLLNRLFGDCHGQPFATRTCRHPGLERLLFDDLLEGFGHDLFDARTGRGTIIFYGPGRLQSMGAIDAVALGKSWGEASRRTTVDIPARLRELVHSRASSSSRSRWLDRHLPR